MDAAFLPSNDNCKPFATSSVIPSKVLGTTLAIKFNA
jgi:hypothetical protein